MSLAIPGVRAALTPPPIITEVRDLDARRYVQAVQAADGQPLEPAVMRAMNALIAGIKADHGSLGVFNQLCLLAGPRTIAGGMVPAAGTAPTAINFVSGDINRQTGWIGDGTTKAIDTGIAGNTLAQNNAAAFIWVTTAGTTNVARVLIGDSLSTGGTVLSTIVSNSLIRIRNQSTTFDNIATAGTTTGFKGVSRAASGSYVARMDGANSTVTRTSEAPASTRLAVYAIDGSAPASRWDGRMAAWGLSSAITHSLIEARLSTYLAALAAAGI
jgi:hypothetical protein